MSPKHDEPDKPRLTVSNAERPEVAIDQVMKELDELVSARTKDEVQRLRRKTSSTFICLLKVTTMRNPGKFSARTCLVDVNHPLPQVVLTSCSDARDEVESATREHHDWRPGCGWRRQQ